MFPPYGATESLPIACIAGREMVGEIGNLTIAGAGTCVGQPFSRIDVKIIEINETPIESAEQMREVPTGEIGEIAVRGPVVTREYYNRPEATRLAKIADKGAVWHRVGDVGYFDSAGRLWFCGRKAHIVSTSSGPLYTEQCEPVFNEHPRVYRSALVGVGPRGQQLPVLVVEPEPDCFPNSPAEINLFGDELKAIAVEHDLTRPIETFLFHESLPVDIRHNVKINREQLAIWSESKLKGASS
jgi:acyl-CoA synthetase (AMP-forming)/AMP-acid ligase II